MYSINYAFVI